MLNSSILFLKTSYSCLGVVKPAILLTIRGQVRFATLFNTREQVIQWLIDDINMKNGEIRIKVQDGKFVLVEIEGRMRNNLEEIKVLEKIHF